MLPLGMCKQNVVVVAILNVVIFSSTFRLIAHYTRRDCRRVSEFGAGKIPLMLMGAQAVGLACTGLGAEIL